jgi:hypothetical protein
MACFRLAGGVTAQGGAGDAPPAALVLDTESVPDDKLLGKTK